MRSAKSLVVLVLGGLAATVIAAPADAATCAKATNIEAIVDDSASMLGTDPNRLRVQAMDLLINALDPGTQLGAVEFGSSFDPAVLSADVVFLVEPVGANAAAMKSALDTKIQGDAGSTDYNAAFNTGRAADPGAQARIFLTDGGHNSGEYNNTHLNPPPQGQTPTYVIGFSAGLSGPDDQARLTKIASDTGGRYFPLPDASALQSVMNEIETTLSCQTPPKTFNDSLAQGKTKAHTVKVGSKSKSAQLALSWTSPLDKFTISGIKVVRKGHVVAKSAKKHKKPKKLKVKVKTGTTFAVIKVSRLVKGTLKFKVKASTIGSGQPKVTLTTQVSQSRRR